MPRRFTDTEKWKDGWYLSLDNDSRIIWQYVLDTCTIAGRWKKNLKLLNFCCNVDISDLKFKEMLDGRVIEYHDFYFIPKFIKYQYPQGLCSNKPAVVAVLKELNSYGLVEVLIESLGNDYPIVKDKDKDKDKDKEHTSTSIIKNKDNDYNKNKVSNKCVFCQKSISSGIMCAECKAGYNDRGK